MKRPTEADKADIHALYEESVQSPDVELDSIAAIFRRRRGRSPLLLREDFCGSAALSTYWVESNPERRAIGLDIDPAVLAYAYMKHILPLAPEAQARIELRRQNVLEPTLDNADVACAYNFSYFIFKKRSEMLAYFRAVHRGLAKDGMFFLDIFGGILAQQPSLEPRDLDTYEYIWEQESFDPLTNDLLSHIHFRFRDGSMVKRAFTYDWRLWTIAELRELLDEAGFTRADAYWEDRDRKGRRTGRFRRRIKVESEPSWNAYVIAER